ncbi:MAG TPA: muconolactone Delta-isomerase [Ilumatobacter sp.]|nr:muconolactone Delta-isomerase [Ilumatobacter sp.]
MLYAVTMQVDIPRDLEPDARAELLAREKAYSQGLQRDGRWRHIWRIAGQHANISIFDVDGNDALHQILWELPLFPYMAVSITPLAHHPSDIISPNDVPLDGRG